MSSNQHFMIAGGTGFVGRALQNECQRRSIDVTLITRDPAAARQEFPKAKAIAWSDLGPASFKGVDALINLAGAGIADKRWSPARLELLRSSRVNTTRQLVSALKAASDKPAVLVQGSAVGIYGRTSGPVAADESSPAGSSGKLPPICQAWEAEAADAPLRTVVLRTGVVLGHGDGALPTMAKPFKMFLGAPLGDGKQIMSWIHLADLIGLIFFAIEEEGLKGPLNGVAPNPLSNRDFSKALAKALHRPCMPIGVPAFMMRLLVGGMAQELILDSLHVVSKRAAGYDFRFPKVEAALADLYP